MMAPSSVHIASITINLIFVTEVRVLSYGKYFRALIAQIVLPSLSFNSSSLDRPD